MLGSADAVLRNDALQVMFTGPDEYVIPLYGPPAL